MVLVDLTALQIIKTLKKAGHTALLAGGCVRDFLLNRVAPDADIATSAHPEEIFQIFPRCLEVGAVFGVVHVVIDKKNYEVATFRKESTYSDGRHPDQIEIGTPEEDASRRDFTINGMFFDIETNTILDFVEGRKDIEKRLIRAIGKPIERFQEDRLRMLRAVRFSATLQFDIEKETECAIIEESKHLFPSVSPERALDELNKMGKSEHFAEGIAKLAAYGLLEQIFPLLSGDGLFQGLKALEKVDVQAPIVLKLALLFLDLSHEERLKSIQALHIRKVDIRLLETFSDLKKLLEEKENASLAEAALIMADDLSAVCLKALKGCFEEGAFWYQKMQDQLAFHIEKIKQKKPLIASHDLKKEGVTPGKIMGLLLKEAQTLSVEKDIKDKATLLAELKALPLWPTDK